MRDPSEALRVEAAGRRICHRITRYHARTFHFASRCLPRAKRRHAYAIYGFCRWADNAVDDADPSNAPQRLAEVRSALELAYSDGLIPPGLAAFRSTIRATGIPRAPFDDLLLGMEMDLNIDRYPDFPSLNLYCYRVAGVVGLMMAHVFGFRDERCLPKAVALGRAMQLTNILRDVGEDLDRGRVYLPLDELVAHGVEFDQLREGRVDDRFRRCMRRLISQARAGYVEAESGIPYLIGASSRLTVRAMARLYGGILDEIERNDFDVFRHRAHVSGRRKLCLLAGCQAASLADNSLRFVGRLGHFARRPDRSLA